MKKFFLFLALFIPVLAAADGPEIRDFPQISPAFEQLFMSRVRDGKLADFPAEVQAYPPDRQMVEVWTGNNPYLRTAVNKVFLTFGADADGKESEFLFTLEFQRDMFVIKHSNPMYGDQAGGFKIAYDKQPSLRKFFYRAKDNQSVAVFIPAFPQYEKERGALICPVEFLNKGSGEERIRLQDTGFRLTNAGAEVDGDTHAYLKNAVNYVMAEAKFIVSRGVRPSLSFLDRTVAQNAQVSLYYKPDPDARVETPDLDNTALGIMEQITLQFNSGFKRVTRQSARAFVKYLAPDKPLPLTVFGRDAVGSELLKDIVLRGITVQKQQLIQAEVGRASCYLVLYQVSPIIHEYLKEDFIVPKSVETSNSE